MREILFRGKREDNSEWVEGYYLLDEQHCQSRHSIWTRDFCGTGVANDLIEIIAETIGQYSGLIDKNGKKIFEGDILRYYSDGRMLAERNGKWGLIGNPSVEERTLVEYDFVSAAYMVHGCMQLCQINYKSEVIGNIYDNPELLNE